MKRMMLAAVFVIVVYPLFAQSVGTVKNEIYKINKVFDSTLYLGFNVDIVYNSDTAYGQFEHEEMSGNYILNDRFIYYKMGSNEYVQNDSFAYNIYHDEKLVVMTRDSVGSKSNLFPLREFIDSAVAAYDTAYLITLRDEDDSKVIEFKSRFDSLPYKRFAIYYDSATHYPDKFEMDFVEGGDFSTADSTPAYDVRVMLKHIVMNFSNYKHFSSTEIFNDENYVLFDKLRKKFRPSEKFRGYRFITNGVDGDDDDESLEVFPAPPPVEQ